MRLVVRFFASYREIVGQKELELDVPVGTTVRELLEILTQRYARLAQVASVSRFVVDQEFVEADTRLKEGSEVVFVPPVAGGGRFEITEDHVTADDLIAEVNNERAGAVVTFVGVVRGFSRDKRVLYLEYEAYREMAEKKLEQIGQEIRDRWGLDRIAIRHRVGHLDVGETAVVIAVASPHRREGFEACQYAIERLKQIVPIWKKEVWEDGEVWVGWQE
ncbi:MAG: molybdopterin converting factor subunit 1 [Chloroflexi bacterium]|nr:molybdopterin converting factor subunit 1 [Chloroflexota bacterium]